MGVVYRRQIIMMDASLSVWGVVFEGRPACSVWMGKYLTWHINSLEMRVVHMVLIHFLSGTLSCYCQEGQYAGGVTHLSPGRLPVAHPRQACAPTPPLSTGQIFVHVPA